MGAGYNQWVVHIWHHGDSLTLIPMWFVHFLRWCRLLKLAMGREEKTQRWNNENDKIPWIRKVSRNRKSDKMSITPLFWGDIGVKKWSLFFVSSTRSPTFSRQRPQKWWNRHLFCAFTTFGSVWALMDLNTFSGVDLWNATEMVRQTKKLLGRLFFWWRGNTQPVSFLATLPYR